MKLTKSKLKEMIREELLTEQNTKLEKVEEKIEDNGDDAKAKFVTKSLKKLVGKRVNVVGLTTNTGPGKIIGADYPYRAGGPAIEYKIKLDSGYTHTNIGNTTGHYVELV